MVLLCDLPLAPRRLRGAAGGDGVLRPQAAVRLPAEHRAEAERGADRLAPQGAEGGRAGPQADRLRHPQPRDPRYVLPASPARPLRSRAVVASNWSQCDGLLQSQYQFIKRSNLVNIP